MLSFICRYNNILRYCQSTKSPSWLSHIAEWKTDHVSDECPFVTTLHVLNSAILKLSKAQPAEKVFRGTNQSLREEMLFCLKCMPFCLFDHHCCSHSHNHHHNHISTINYRKVTRAAFYQNSFGFQTVIISVVVSCSFHATHTTVKQVPRGMLCFCNPITGVLMQPFLYNMLVHRGSNH